MTLVDDVKQRLDIVQVVSQYADLDTRSRAPKALCPFHVERTPSFVVFPDSGTWRCFGACSVGGDVIAFVMRKENLGFGEALRRLADQAGIKEPTLERRRETDALVEANEAAASYFSALLAAPGGAGAREYLAGRGIDEAAAKRRGLGLSPSGIETLADHLKAKGVSAGAAQTAGLVRQGRDGSWHDMFRGRLTFEIHDRRGRIVGFGARTLDGSEPKYINSPRSAVFDKSRLLYGLDWAADGVRASGTAVVVEGYMDVIAAHEAGFGNVVASMGTAITAEQVAVLRGLTETVVLALDSDAAGQAATRNSLTTVWNAVHAEGAAAGRRPAEGGRSGLAISVARLDSGKDPDEVIRSDPAAWRTAVSSAAPLLEYLLQTAPATHDLSSPQGKAAATEELFPLITRVENTYEQDQYLTRLAATLGVTLEQLRASTARPAARRRRRPGDRGAPAGGETSASALDPASVNAIEDHLLALVLQHDELREYAMGAADEQFRDPVNGAIFTLLGDSARLDDAARAGEGGVAEKIERLRARRLPPMDQRDKVSAVSDCVRRLHQRHIQMLKAEESKMLPESGQPLSSDPDEAEALATLIVESTMRLRDLFARRS
ncbi:MAG: DNA primase [Dehalococcoidia bacterium]